MKTATKRRRSNKHSATTRETTRCNKKKRKATSDNKCRGQNSKGNKSTAQTENARLMEYHKKKLQFEMQRKLSDEKMAELELELLKWRNKSNELDVKAFTHSYYYCETMMHLKTMGDMLELA